MSKGEIGFKAIVLLLLVGCDNKDSVPPGSEARWLDGEFGRVSRHQRNLAVAENFPPVAFFGMWDKAPAKGPESKGPESKEPESKEPESKEPESKEPESKEDPYFDLSCVDGYCRPSDKAKTLGERYGVCKPLRVPEEVWRESNAYDAYGATSLGVVDEDGNGIEGCSMLYVGGGYLLSEEHCVKTLLCENETVGHRALFGFDVQTLASDGMIRDFGIGGAEAMRSEAKDVDCQSYEVRVNARMRESRGNPKVPPDCKESQYSSMGHSVDGLALVELKGHEERLPSDPDFGCRAPEKGEKVYSLSYPGGSPLMLAKGGVVKSVAGGVLVVEGLLHSRQSSSAPIFSEDGELIGVADGSRERTRYCAVDGAACVSEIGCGGACGVVYAVAMSEDLCNWYTSRVDKKKKKKKKKEKEKRR